MADEGLRIKKGHVVVAIAGVLLSVLLFGWSQADDPPQTSVLPPATSSTEPPPERTRQATPSEPLPPRVNERGPPAPIQDRDEPTEEDGQLYARCDFDTPVDSVWFSTAGEGTQVRPFNNQLRLPVPGPEGQGRLDMEGFRPVVVRWSDVTAAGGGECRMPTPRRQPGMVNGIVHNADDLPDGEVKVEGCGQSKPVDQEGGFFFYSEPDVCTIRAVRHKGFLAMYGDPVEVVIEAERETMVDLWLPDHRPAGMGIRLEEVEGGIGVADVVDGSPAEELGLSSGDVIVSIEGQPTEDMTNRDFMRYGIGPEGTSVTFEIMTEEGPTEMELERRFIQSGD